MILFTKKVTYVAFKSKSLVGKQGDEENITSENKMFELQTCKVWLDDRGLMETPSQKYLNTSHQQLRQEFIFPKGIILNKEKSRKQVTYLFINVFNN